MIDLLPCPFCGSTNLRYEFSGSQGYIKCNECGTEGPCDEKAADPICDMDAAYAIWNRRAALAQPIPVGPTDEELGIIYHDSCRGCEFMDQGGFEDGARAVLARWGHLKPQPAPPVEGEVAELVAALQADAECAEVEHYDLCNMTAHQMRRAADLLERQQPVPVPVPVSERLPGAEDTLRSSDATTLLIANDDEWCWGQERSLLTGKAAPRWRFMRVSSLQDEAVNWLPAHALPIPPSEND